MVQKQEVDNLLQEWALCKNAHIHSNVIEVQLAKDKCSKLATVLEQAILWGNDDAISEAYTNLSPVLQKLKERIVITVLKE